MMSVLPVILLFILVGFMLAAGWFILHHEQRDIYSETARGNMARVRTLLDKKPALIHSKSPDGNTPLHMAAWHGHRDLVEYLISRGADIQARTDHGKTALAIAEEQGYEEITAFLRSHAQKGVQQDTTDPV